MRLTRTAVAFSTAIVLIAASVLGVVLLPWPSHVALTSAGSSQLLGTSPTQARLWSDATIHRLLFGGSFETITGPRRAPFYAPSEASHLGDVRIHLYILLSAALLGLIVIGLGLWRTRDRQAMWHASVRGAWGVIIGVMVLIAVGMINFNSGFVWFHKILFPEGDYAFAPTSNLISLYPDPFWEVLGIYLGVFLAVLACLVWLVEIFTRKPTPT